MQFVFPLGFGGLMYYLGGQGILQKYYKQYFESKSTQTQKIQKVQQKQQNLQNSSTTVINNTFAPDAITSTIRSFQINPKCRIIYSTLHKCPLSVHQLLDLATIQGNAQRAKSFHQDPNIQPEKFASKNEHFSKTNAYRNLQLNRGHMAAASNFSCQQDLKNSTFSFANVVPQHSYNNGGIWNTFQRYCRILLKQKKCDTLEIISGPIFNSNKKLQGYNEIYLNQQKVLLKNGMVVPTRLYKIIKCNTKDKTYASGFTFANEKTYDNLKTLIQFQQSLEQIQDETGLTFNFKDKITGKLSQYDHEGLNRSKLRYDKQFYQKLFDSAQKLQDMNSALRRAYQQRISIDQQRQKVAPKIQTQGFKQLTQIKQNKSYSECNKLSNYLSLHRTLFYLGLDKGRFKQLSEQIQKQIKQTIYTCRNTASLQQEVMISNKAARIQRKYHYPQHILLKQNFPKQTNGSYDPRLNKKDSNTSEIPTKLSKSQEKQV